MKILITGNFIYSEKYAPYQRIMNLMKIMESKSEYEYNLNILSLNNFTSGNKFILFYPFFFFKIFFRSWWLLKDVIKNKDLKFVYFYGRNASMFLPILLLSKIYGKKIMVDHVENPIYLYKISILYSWIRFDQFLGYPLIWMFSDLNVYISRAYERSFFFRNRKSNSQFVPVIIRDLKPLKVVKSGIKSRFLIISSLTERDNISKLLEFIESAKGSELVEFNVLGRFKNRMILDSLSTKVNVKLYDNASEEVKENLMKTVDYFLLFRNFSMAELYSSPTRLAEFISYNKPVIVNDSAFVKEVVGETNDGFYEWKQNENFDSVIKNVSHLKSFNLSSYTNKLHEAINKMFEILAI